MKIGKVLRIITTAMVELVECFEEEKEKREGIGWKENLVNRSAAENCGRPFCLSGMGKTNPNGANL